MTTYILTTVIVLGVGLVLSGIGILLAVAVVWTGRRIGDASEIRGMVHTVDTKIENLSEMFESYRKRDAQRESTAAKRTRTTTVRATDQEEKEVVPEESSVIRSGDDVLKLFERQGGIR